MKRADAMMYQIRKTAFRPPSLQPKKTKRSITRKTVTTMNETRQPISRVLTESSMPHFPNGLSVANSAPSAALSPVRNETACIEFTDAGAVVFLKFGINQNGAVFTHKNSMHCRTIS